MDKQRMEKKKLAKHFKKIVDGYATNEEILAFLDCAFSLSSLSQQIKQKPVVALNNYLPSDKFSRVRGRYSKKNLSFDLNPLCFHDVRYDRPGALLELINIYGHEMTHHCQNEMNIENEFVPNAEQIRSACEFMGKEITQDILETLAFSSYYLCKSEIMARDGGIRFCNECLVYLDNNKYIYGKYKSKVKELLNENRDISKREIDLGVSCQDAQNKLKKYLLSFDLNYFLKKEKECVTKEEKNDFFNSFNLRVKLMEPEEMVEEFLMVKEKEDCYVKMILKQAVRDCEFEVVDCGESKIKTSYSILESQNRRK